MYREPSANVDRRALQADHSVPRILGGGQADRLMLATCNLSMGASLGNRLRGIVKHQASPLPRW